MFYFDLNALGRKASELLDKSTDILADTLQVAKNVGIEVTKGAKDIVQDISSKTDSVITDSHIPADVRSKVTKVLNGFIETVDRTNISTGHKILMMGGRRAGKSTILSSILTQLRENTPGTICTIIDQTDYTQEIETKYGYVPLPTLDVKQNEIRNYISKRQKGTEFLVDMSPTSGKASYILEVSAGNTAIPLEFIDVPGEWMRTNVHDHSQLVSLVECSDVFVIAIDTPFMMNTDDAEGTSVNMVYNRVNEITQTMAKLKINSKDDLKQIILCPVKCERWIRAGEAYRVVDKVLKSYRDLINRWVDCPEVTIQIMPIQTVGGFESTRMLPAKLYFKDDKDRTGESCSVDPVTKDLMTKDGARIRKYARIEDDPFWSIDYMDIPLSWYRLNSENGLKPKFCEQPGYHILDFLLRKEENAIRSKAEAEKKKMDKNNPIWNFLTRVFNPTFGQYIPIWKNVICRLNSNNMIKTDGDGFCYVKSKIE